MSDGVFGYSTKRITLSRIWILRKRLSILRPTKSRTRRLFLQVSAGFFATTPARVPVGANKHRRSHVDLKIGLGVKNKTRVKLDTWDVD